MSLSLGEKLRQAREAKGFTISGVAEQTRISSQYLESIESDDYRTLPGGIFNKGFLKSYAKFVGVDEHEALADYAVLTAVEQAKQDEAKPYRPEVLTDDRSSGSMIPTVVLAAVILAALTGGTLVFLKYRQPAEPAANTPVRSNGNVAAEQTLTSLPASADTPDMRALRVEIRTLNAPVSLLAVSDGKSTTSTVAPGTSMTFEPRESLKLSYARAFASAVEMSINGKPIRLPTAPLLPRRNIIEFEINGANLNQIWSSGVISGGAAPTGRNANANAEAPAVSNSATVQPTAAPRRPAATPSPRPATNANLPRQQPSRTPSPPTPARTPEERP